ncbi:selenocysteine-specific translation elongation factor [Candidatus Solirubrobacter pratensis]|uniref:selenocysteine-specific translation elongation factor n=1 Tax=Candidatus Solirubrobacter pratensis TaxID=1298857 RepID=UPI00040C92C5|nr:selenocysteine-specific translation elongation factor [Candidatus Solirubrobacter pratensis]
MPLTLGTAGHIDHGKTALVRALTGIDTDRLPEEKRRGISIALGYAPLELAAGRVSVVDVPGHERFVRTMVAGATGIDFFLMVVAADDGVMPQTREHAAVLAALGVDAGVVAVTKADVADPARALAEAAALLPGAEAVAVSAVTGAGLAELRDALDRAAERVVPRAADGVMRLHVDRVFSIRGAGTVVTGTLWSGEAVSGAQVAILPSGRRARIRGVEVHDEAVERAGAGQRVALNLAGLDRDEVARGAVVVAGDAGADLAASYRVDVALAWATPESRPDGGARVGVHHGTRETAARLAELGGRFFQLRLEEPIVPAYGDRVVIRSLAPPDTLGGGVVLDPAPRRHGPSRDLLARLVRLERGEPEPEPVVAPEPEPEPVAPPDYDPELEERLKAAGHEPPADAELGSAEAFAALRAHGRAVRLGRDMHIHPEALARVEARVVALGEAGEITLAGLRDDLGTSRKYAQALLEHFDAARLTLRVGDARRLRRRR